MLVVEDEESVAALTRRVLVSHGYEVTTAANAMEALGALADTGKIDLLLTDMVLPETDGAQIAEKALAARPNLRVLFMSGYTEHPVLRHPAFDRGAPFIQKPFSPAALRKKIREVLGG